MRKIFFKENDFVALFLTLRLMSFQFYLIITFNNKFSDNNYAIMIINAILRIIPHLTDLYL